MIYHTWRYLVNIEVVLKLKPWTGFPSVRDALSCFLTWVANDWMNIVKFIKVKLSAYWYEISSERNNYSTEFFIARDRSKNIKGHLSTANLPKLHSPLVKRIDSPNKTFHSNSMFIDCQQLGKQIGDIRAKNSIFTASLKKSISIKCLSMENPYMTGTFCILRGKI